MTKLWIPLLCLCFVACDKDSKSGSGGKDVQFEVTEVISEKDTEKILTCFSGNSDKKNRDMDSRLRSGLVYVEQSSYKDYEDKAGTTQVTTQTIESVDHDKNSFVSKTNLELPDISGWYKSETRFEFAEGFGSSKVDFLDASPNLKPLIEQAQNESEEEYEYTNCMPQYGKDNYKRETVIENGNYIFSDGRKISAQRQIETETGNIECIRYQSQNNKEPKELSRFDAGLGKSVRTIIYTKDVPSTDTCSDLFDVLYTQETVSDDNKVNIKDENKFTRIVF